MGDARRLPSWVFRTLTYVGALSVAIVGLAATRVFLMTGTHYTIVLTAAVAASALALMWLERRATLARCARRLGPVAGFAVAGLVVAAITSVRMPPGTFSLFRVSLGPVCWVSSAVLGYLAGRSRIVPLAVASVTAGGSAAAGGLSLLAARGYAGSLVGAYSSWSASLGAWSPGPGEAFRSVGLEVDPNTFGLVGVVALVAALCLAGPGWLRAVVAGTAAAVIVLSGSRTATVAALLALAAVVLVGLVVERLPLRSQIASLAPVGLGLLVAAVLAGGALVASGQGVPGLARLAQAAANVEDAGGTSGAVAVDAATNGRRAIWSAALAWYRRYPLGAFLTPESLVGRSIHNEYLERLLYGGPLLLLALVGLQLWIALRLRPASAPALGPALAVVYVAAAMALGPSLLPPFFGMGFYLVGWGSAQPRCPRARGAGTIAITPEDDAAGGAEKATAAG